jgi:hypothetical protein
MLNLFHQYKKKKNWEYQEEALHSLMKKDVKNIYIVPHLKDSSFHPHLLLKTNKKEKHKQKVRNPMMKSPLF